MEPKRFVRAFIGVVLMLVGLAPALASADEMSYRIVSYIAKWDVKPVGDVEGHESGTWVRRGLVFFKGGPADGEVAVYVNVGTIDQTKESRKAVAEATFTFDDGSTFKARNVTIGPPTSVLKKAATVTNEVIGGTGRFAGIVGKATGTGKIITPNGGDTKGDAYYDMVLTYTLPKPKA